MNKRDLPHHFVDGVSGLSLRSEPSRYTLRPEDDEKFAVDFAIVPRLSDVLVVALHGGVELGANRLPKFEWLRTLASESFSQLYISDPTLTLDENLINGWYMGDAEEDLSPRLAELIQAVAVKLKARSIVLFGSSAGGFAAARIGSYIPNSVALAFSTQRNLAYGPIAHVEGFFKFVIPEFSSYGMAHAELGRRISLEETVDPSTDGQRFVWVQNTGDVEHMRDHFEPYAERLNALQISGDVHLIRKYYGPGHPIPPLSLLKASLAASIEFAQTGHFSGVDWADQAHRPPANTPMSLDVPAPELIAPEDGSTQASGYVSFRGSGIPGDVIVMTIEKTIYQAVYVDLDGYWNIDQGFAPGARWQVSLSAFRSGYGKSYAQEITLRVV